VPDPAPAAEAPLRAEHEPITGAQTVAEVPAGAELGAGAAVGAPRAATIPAQGLRELAPRLQATIAGLVLVAFVVGLVIGLILH
jgi:hypothetical protein